MKRLNRAMIVMGVMGAGLWIASLCLAQGVAPGQTVSQGPWGGGVQPVSFADDESCDANEPADPNVPSDASEPPGAE